VELPVGKIWKEVRESQTIFAAAGDTQAKPTRVSGGLDILVFFLFRSRSRSSHRPIRACDIPNCSESLWV
jgi:hypothetical protein